MIGKTAQSFGTAISDAESENNMSFRILTSSDEMAWQREPRNGETDS